MTSSCVGLFTKITHRISLVMRRFIRFWSSTSRKLGLHQFIYICFLLISFPVDSLLPSLKITTARVQIWWWYSCSNAAATATVSVAEYMQCIQCFMIYLKAMAKDLYSRFHGDSEIWYAWDGKNNATEWYLHNRCYVLNYRCLQNAYAYCVQK